MTSAGAALSIAIGLLEIALAGAVLLRLREYGRRFPWLVALTAFFVVRGGSRLYVGFVGEEPSAATLGGDAIVLATLVVLLVGLERTVSGIGTVQFDAQRRKEEYERALADYKTLARHRLGNPIASILGGVYTLRHQPELAPETRDDLLAMIEEEARRLEEVALAPRVETEEERGFRPRPRLRGYRRRGDTLGLPQES